MAMYDDYTQNQMYTFVVCTHEGHDVRYVYCNRREADKTFDKVVASEAAKPTGLSVAYYSASVGGLVNAWSAPK